MPSIRIGNVEANTEDFSEKEFEIYRRIQELTKRISLINTEIEELNLYSSILKNELNFQLRHLDFN